MAWSSSIWSAITGKSPKTAFILGAAFLAALLGADFAIAYFTAQTPLQWGIAVGFGVILLLVCTVILTGLIRMENNQRSEK